MLQRTLNIRLGSLRDNSVLNDSSEVFEPESLMVRTFFWEDLPHGKCIQ